MRNQHVRRRLPFAVGLSSLSLLTLLPSLVLAQTTAAPGATAPGATPSSPAAAPPASAMPEDPYANSDVNPPAKAPEPPPAPSTATPAAAPAPASATTTTDAAADAEVAALEQQTAEAAASNDGLKVDLYGFADFSYGIAVKDFAYTAPFNSFAVGNLNLYLASNLGDSWRSLAEVRFSYLPHGSTPPDLTGQATRVDTTTGDYTDLNRPVRWGGIIIQRAYLEYLAHPLVNIRAGQFLTPYGIWNVDHGSPVIIGVRRPFIIGEALLPQSQTGIEIYGTHHFEPVEVGYHLTLSNGRGPIDTYQDLNNNKAFGWRLFGRADTKAGQITLGFSGYKGRYTDRTTVWGPDADGNFVPTYPVTSDYNELSIAGDLKYEYGGFLLQSEAIMNDTVYDQQRPVDQFAALAGGPPGFVPDFRRVGVYGLTGYRFKFLGTMPFAGAEYYDAGRVGLGGKSAAFWGGLNVRPTARVVLKAQYTYSWFPGSPAGVPDNSHYNNIDLQAAWSF